MSGLMNGLTMDDVARLADLGEIGGDLYACLLLADRQYGRQCGRDANANP